MSRSRDIIKFIYWAPLDGVPQWAIAHSLLSTAEARIQSKFQLENFSTDEKRRTILAQNELRENENEKKK